MCVFETTSYSIARLVRSLFRESGLNHRAPKANGDRYSDEFNDNWAGLQCGDSIGDWIDDNSYISEVHRRQQGKYQHPIVALWVLFL